MALIPPDIIEDVRIQTDIVNLVGEYVKLEKKGRNYTGICPFHQERDPSFTVSPEKQIFYCFGCQAGGNAIKFLMLIENLTFVESVRRLANRAGIYFPDPEKFRDHKRAAREERAWKANAQAMEFYHHYLLNSPGAAQAREYLDGRGLSADIIKKFNIGYSPAAWDALLSYMAGLGYRPGELADYGLAVRDKGRTFDRFRNRIMFPVADAQGRVVAFGGRVLGQEKNQPKYLNTPETPFFNKSKVLFGLNLARQAIRQAGYAVIMEGYMDVVTAHQYGIYNVLASMGTSLTPDQGKILMRYTRDIYMAYDTDSAGVKAAARGLDILQQLGCRLKVISMPEGADPDDFIRENGVEGWREIIAGAETLLEFKLRLAQKGKADPVDVLAEVLPNLAEMKSDIELEEGVKLVASRLNLSWESVKGEIRRFKADQRKIRVKPDKIAKNTYNIIKSDHTGNAVSAAEIGLLRAVVENPERLDYFRSALGDDFFQEPLHRDLYQAIAGKIDRGEFDPPGLLDELEDRAAALLSRLVMEAADESNISPGRDTEKVVNDYINVIRKNLQAKKRMILLQELAQAEKNKDIELVKSILKKLQEIR
ncbi:MAG: DNA primase [Peptococcaceae bacterium]|nr:DNA primase [Peptococcaceae bacterium]